MSTQVSLKEVIFEVIDSVNSQLPADKKIQKDLETRLAGEGGLDSLSIVLFLVNLEERLSERLGRPIHLLVADIIEKKHDYLYSIVELMGFLSNKINPSDSKGAIA